MTYNRMTTIEEERQIRWYPLGQRKLDFFFFFVVENFEFSGVDYCCTITTNYTEAINPVDSENWILSTQRKFHSLVENNTFEW